MNAPLNLSTMPMGQLFRIWHRLRLCAPRDYPPVPKMETFQRPAQAFFPKYAHGFNSVIEKLLDRIDLQSGKKYLFAYDIDGTLMNAQANDVMFDIDRAGKAPNAAVHVLRAMNQEHGDKVRNVMLTARCNDDFRMVQEFDDVPIYGNFGYARTNGAGSWEPHRSRPVLMPQIMDSVLTQYKLGPFLSHYGIKRYIDFTFDPNSFYFKLRDHNIAQKAEIKENILKILNQGKSEDDAKWWCEESPDGTLLILINDAIPFDKAKGIHHVIKNEELDEDTTLVILGDTGMDLKAMTEAKRLLGDDRVINVAVGPKLAEKQEVDFVFRDHIDIRRFIGRLYKKLDAYKVTA